MSDVYNYPDDASITARTGATLESSDMTFVGCDSSGNPLKTDYEELKIGIDLSKTLFIFIVGANGTSIFYSSSTNGVTWSTFAAVGSLPATGSQNDFTSSNINGTIVQFFRDSTNVIYTRQSTALSPLTFGSWGVLAGASSGPVSVTPVTS